MSSEKCPICGNRFECPDKASHATYPFCKERCQLIDFNRWCEGAYKIVEEVDLENVQIEMNMEDIRKRIS